MGGALDGLRVIDLASVVMGPYACQILGDLGAEVIKIEPPAGDMTRRTLPQRNPGMGALALNVNRNKRSVALDLKTDAGRAVLDDLLDTADVLVTNMRPGALDRLGLADQPRPGGRAGAGGVAGQRRVRPGRIPTDPRWRCWLMPGGGLISGAVGGLLDGMNIKPTREACAQLRRDFHAFASNPNNRKWLQGIPQSAWDDLIDGGQRGRVPTRCASLIEL